MSLTKQDRLNTEKNIKEKTNMITTIILILMLFAIILISIDQIFADIKVKKLKDEVNKNYRRLECQTFLFATAQTSCAEDVTLQEIASFIVDGSPIMREGLKQVFPPMLADGKETNQNTESEN